MTALIPGMLEARADFEARWRRLFARFWCERVTGHDMQFIGGAHAGVVDECDCSVPVHTCTRCGACDFGDNAEGRETRKRCREEHSEP